MFFASSHMAGGPPRACRAWPLAWPSPSGPPGRQRVRTSQGPGPGVKVLPASEASRLCYMKYAVYGDRDPSQATGPEPVDRPFGSPPARRPAQSN
jgi:hypothetical protein